MEVATGWGKFIQINKTLLSIYLFKNEEYQNWTRISEIEVLPKNANYKYARKLVIQNITYPYTGFYQCLDKNADSFDENHGSSIYLFVKGLYMFEIKLNINFCFYR